MEAIVDEVTIGNKKFVLVKWLGYELDTKDWSPAADVKHTTPYLVRIRLVPGHGAQSLGGALRNAAPGFLPGTPC